ncbi:MAG: MATE family efflux transporter [Clostridia bacterium]|nr:MATE family efflux transporter [Clostridia bacterium]
MARDMTKGSIARTLILFSIPLIFSGLLQQLYSWADAFIVGNVEGEAALAAVGASSVISSLFVSVITGFTSGVSILSARLFGTSDEGAQKKILCSFALILGGIFLALSLLGALLTGPFLKMLDTPADIFDESRRYLGIVMLGMPFLAVYNVYSAVLRGVGDSKAPFLSVLFSSVLNVILDVVMVYCLRWRVAGAAIATVVSQALMTVFIVVYAVRRYEILRFRASKKLFDRGVIRDGCRLALPITIQSGVSSVGHLVLQNFMNGFGTVTVAAITSAYRVDSVILLPIINLGTAISTITAQNAGANRPDRVRRSLTVGSAIMAVTSLALTALVVIFGGSLVAVFGVTPEAAQIGADFFRALGSFYIVFGLATAMRGFLEGIGDVVFSGVNSIAMLAMRIALSYLLADFYGNMVIAWAEAYAWCFMLILFILRVRQQTKKLAR